MCEQTRQQIAGELAYIGEQLHEILVLSLPGARIEDRSKRALDAIERIQSYLARSDGPSTVPAGWDHV